MIGYIVMEGVSYEGLLNDGGPYKLYLNLADAEIERARLNKLNKSWGYGQIIEIDLSELAITK